MMYEECGGDKREGLEKPDPLEIASMANNVYIGGYYLRYLEMGLEREIVGYTAKYFANVRRLIAAVKNTGIEVDENKLGEFEAVLEKIKGTAGREEVERAKEFADYVATSAEITSELVEVADVACITHEVLT